MKHEEELERIKDGNRVGGFRGRVQRGRGKTEREICPKCKSYYLKSCYIYSQVFIEDKKGGRWIKVGKYCPNCKSFFPDF